MLMQTNNFSIGLGVSGSIWEKTNVINPETRIKKERSKIYSDFDDKFGLTYDILTSKEKYVVRRVLMIDVDEDSLLTQNIKRVSRNYLYFKCMIYLFSVLGIGVSVFLVSKLVISMLDAIVGIGIAIVFAIFSSKILNDSENKVVNEWKRTKVHHK